MRILDTSASRRLPVYLDMVRELSLATQPQEVLRTYSQAMLALDGPAGFISISCRDLQPGEYRITRLLVHDDASEGYRTDSWSQPKQFPVYRGGLLGQIIERGESTVILDLDVTDDPVVGASLARYRSLLAMPIYDHGLPLNWAMQLRHEPDAFDLERLEDNLLRGNLVGGTVRHVQTARQLQQAHEAIRAEVHRIGAIQRSLLPERLPDIPGLTLAASYETFDQAGGDMYLFHEMGTSLRSRDAERPDGRWALFVGDVSGHGPSAAVVMAMVQALIYSYVDPARSEQGFLEYLNDHLCAKRIENSFVTGITAVFDPATRRLDYSCAGHPPPMLHRRGDPPSIASLLNVGNLPLGIMPDIEYPVTHVQLDPGDTLVFYTDGITEARANDGAFFGTEGLSDTLMTCSGSPSCVVDAIKQRLHAFQAGARPQDDQTLLVLQLAS
jgi:sigma-B regulation protein RsbU (phosphoserine phosphatase)